jgi:hypothetical protein
MWQRALIRVRVLLRFYTGRDLYDGSAACLLVEYSEIAPRCAKKLDMTARKQFVVGDRPIYVCDSCYQLLTDNWQGTILNTMRAIQPSFASRHAMSQAESRSASLSEQVHTLDRALGHQYDEVQSEYERFEVLRDVATEDAALALDGKSTNIVGLQKIVIRHAAELEAKLGDQYEVFERSIFRDYGQVQLPEER